MGAARAVRRSNRAFASLPHALIRHTVLNRMNSRIAPLTSWQREDGHQLVCLACHCLRIQDGEFPTPQQWKEIFRSVRSGLGIDRERNREMIAEVISCDPWILRHLDVAADTGTDEAEESGSRSRQALSEIARDLHSRLVRSFAADGSRKRKARFQTQLRFLRSGRHALKRPLFVGNSSSAMRKALFDFKSYAQGKWPDHQDNVIHAFADLPESFEETNLRRAA